MYTQLCLKKQKYIKYIKNAFILVYFQLKIIIIIININNIIAEMVNNDKRMTKE